MKVKFYCRRYYNCGVDVVANVCWIIVVLIQLYIYMLVLLRIVLVAGDFFKVYSVHVWDWRQRKMSWSRSMSPGKIVVVNKLYLCVSMFMFSGLVFLAIVYICSLGFEPIEIYSLWRSLFTFLLGLINLACSGSSCVFLRLGFFDCSPSCKPQGIDESCRMW